MARWANFFAEMPLEGLCWASFFAELLRNGALGEFFAEPQALMVGVWWGRRGRGPPPPTGGHNNKTKTPPKIKTKN